MVGCFELLRIGDLSVPFSELAFPLSMCGEREQSQAPFVVSIVTSSALCMRCGEDGHGKVRGPRRGPEGPGPRSEAIARSAGEQPFGAADRALRELHKTTRDHKVRGARCRFAGCILKVLRTA